MIYEDLANHDPENAEPIEEEALMPDVEDFEYTDVFDQYILASVMLLKDYGFARALVKKRNRDSDGNIMVSYHYNPLLDTCVYEVQFQNVLISEYEANLIDKILYSQIDPDGNESIILKDILDHR